MAIPAGLFSSPRLSGRLARLLHCRAEFLLDPHPLRHGARGERTGLEDAMTDTALCMKPGNIQHPTSNIEPPRAALWSIIGCWALDVGCWMFPLGSGILSLSHSP